MRGPFRIFEKGGIRVAAFGDLLDEALIERAALDAQCGILLDGLGLPVRCWCLRVESKRNGEDKEI